MMLKLKNISKNYGKLQAVNNLSLRVEKGSIFGFVGPNGAGKTTTMKIMATLLRPSSGQAWIAGEEISQNPRRIRQMVGFMPDYFGVYDDLKVDEYLDFYAEGYRIPVRQRKIIIDDLLELMDLSSKRKAYVDSLSRGMKQRLCLARCLVHDPCLLILDEPVSGQDPRARVEIREILKELRSRGKTIIVSSHVLPELAEMCTHISIIEAGRMLISGTVDEVMHRTNTNRIQVRVMDRVEETSRRLNDMGYAAAIIDANSLEFPWNADEGQLTNILRNLIEADLPVVSFAEVNGNLEDIFMQLTKGVIQ